VVHLQLNHNKFSMDGAMVGAKSFSSGGGEGTLKPLAMVKNKNDEAK
jgi:hypothetical protein